MSVFTRSVRSAIIHPLLQRCEAHVSARYAWPESKTIRKDHDPEELPDLRMLANRTEAGSAASRYPIPLYSFFLYDSNLFVRKAVHMVRGRSGRRSRR